MHVLKFGGACLSTVADIQAIANKISERYKQGEKLLVVVSAMGKSTDELHSLAAKISQNPPLRELDMLLSAGERISMSLMCMALDKLGVPAISFTGSQAGILTKGNHNDAEIFDIRPVRVESALNQNKVVVLAGFQGVDPHTKEVTTLGRGGSDVTAVAMAAHFKAMACEILKDVDGVYDMDPKLNPAAVKYEKLNYTQLKTMCELGCKVLHPRAIALAAEYKVNLRIAAAHFDHTKATEVTETANNNGIAVNIINNVLELGFKNPNQQNNWRSYLLHKQIPLPTVLFSKDNKLYITAHKELLSYVQQVLQAWDKSIQATAWQALSLTYLSEDLFLKTSNLEKYISSSAKAEFIYENSKAKVFIVDEAPVVLKNALIKAKD